MSRLAPRKRDKYFQRLRRIRVLQECMARTRTADRTNSNDVGLSVRLTADDRERLSRLLALKRVREPKASEASVVRDLIRAAALLGDGWRSDPVEAAGEELLRMDEGRPPQRAKLTPGQVDEALRSIGIECGDAADGEPSPKE